MLTAPLSLAASARTDSVGVIIEPPHRTTSLGADWLAKKPYVASVAALCVASTTPAAAVTAPLR
jgi:hypothetical protein